MVKTNMKNIEQTIREILNENIEESVLSVARKFIDIKLTDKEKKEFIKKFEAYSKKFGQKLLQHTSGFTDWVYWASASDYTDAPFGFKFLANGIEFIVSSAGIDKIIMLKVVIPFDKFDSYMKNTHSIMKQHVEFHRKFDSTVLSPEERFKLEKYSAKLIMKFPKKDTIDYRLF